VSGYVELMQSLVICLPFIISCHNLVR